jgi:microcystin-dependent protein
MPYNGSGIFNPLITFEPNTPATATGQNSQDADFATGLTNAITRDGQGTPTGNISWNNNRITNLGNPVAGTDACNYQSAQAVGMPSGCVLPFAGSAAPTGFFICNGQAISRVTYASLFAVIGTTYGAGNGSTTFNVPDLRSRTVVAAGQGSGLSNRILSTTGGEEAVTLNVSQIPSHNHSDFGHGHTDSGHSHGINDPTHNHSYSNNNQLGFPFAAGLGGGGSTGATTGNSATGISIQSGNASITTGFANISSTGGGGSHDNMSPWMALNYIIKT